MHKYFNILGGKKQMNESIILHSDVNNFFASVECAAKPELKDKPVAVAGNPQKRTGIILAKNEVAKKFGIKTGQTIFEAKALCPELICLEPHYHTYEKISSNLHKIYLEYTDQVEPLGLDECWLDVTSSSKVLGKTGEEIAYEIKERIKKEFGITVSVGVSFSKIFAKLGSDLKKPDAITILSRENFKEKTYHLPLNSIVGIGRRLEKKFTNMNVLTIGDYVSLDDDYLKKITNITGVELKHALLGEFDHKINSYYDVEQVKSIGNGTTTIKDITSRNDIQKVVYFLSEKVCQRMINRSLIAKTISVSVKTNELKTFGKSKTIYPTNSSQIFAKECMILLDSFWHYDIPIRAVRVNGSNLESTHEFKQLSLFNDKKESLSKSIAYLTKKYGESAIYVASETPDFINKHTFKDN